MTSIHTSDRILFKRCRRKWNYASPLRLNLEPKEVFSIYFWVGTGFHFALEDYHGYNKFGDPAKAFQAYYECFDRNDLTMECEAYTEIVPVMFDHYINSWLPKRKQFKTFWLNGKPQVEVEVILELKELSKLVGKPVYYSMRFDRMVLDEYDRLWVMDYKTVSSFDTNKLETDPQISVYSWGAELFYQRPIEGMIYLQFRKVPIGEPKILKRPAGAISIDKNQNTNYYRYLDALKDAYGSLEEAPAENLETLDFLWQQESELGDKYIRYDLVRRNKYSKDKQYELILQESKDMLNPNLSIYPNPTRDCYKDCPFRAVCLAEDDGSDPSFILNNNYENKRGDKDKWRKKLIYPQQSQKIQK